MALLASERAQGQGVVSQCGMGGRSVPACLAIGRMQGRADVVGGQRVANVPLSAGTAIGP